LAGPAHNLPLVRSLELSAAARYEDYSDFGTTIQIVYGVTPSDKVINNPSDSLTTGAIVHVASSAAPGQSPTSSPSKVAKK